MTPAELRTWREQHALSQPQLAQLVGVSAMTVYKWEAGKHAIPSMLDLALRTLDREQTVIHSNGTH